jgi:hypothetical protein
MVAEVGRMRDRSRLSYRSGSSPSPRPVGRGSRRRNPRTAVALLSIDPGTPVETTEFSPKPALRLDLGGERPGSLPVVGAEVSRPPGPGSAGPMVDGPEAPLRPGRGAARRRRGPAPLGQVSAGPSPGPTHFTSARSSPPQPRSLAYVRQKQARSRDSENREVLVRRIARVMLVVSVSVVAVAPAALAAGGGRQLFQE